MDDDTYAIVHGIFLTVQEHPRHPGKWMGVISDGMPQRGHNPCFILEVEVRDTRDEVLAWYEMRRQEQWPETLQ